MISEISVPIFWRFFDGMKKDDVFTGHISSKSSQFLKKGKSFFIVSKDKRMFNAITKWKIIKIIKLNDETIQSSLKGTSTNYTPENGIAYCGLTI